MPQEEGIKGLHLFLLFNPSLFLKYIFLAVIVDVFASSMCLFFLLFTYFTLSYMKRLCDSPFLVLDLVARFENHEAIKTV